MPVEIKELVIKTVVEEERQGGDNVGSAPENTQQDITIQLCVEKILEILKDKNER